MRILRFNTILKHGVSTACLHPGLKSLRFNIILKLAFLCSNLHGLRSIWFNTILKQTHRRKVEEEWLRALRFNTILKRDRGSCALNTGLRNLQFDIILKLSGELSLVERLRTLRFNTILKLYCLYSTMFPRLRTLRFNTILKPQNKYGRIPQKRAARNQKKYFHKHLLTFIIFRCII